MIHCTCCGHSFAPSAAAFHDAQIIPRIQYTILFTCPGKLESGAPCLSTRSILIWESFDIALHFGEAVEEDDDGYWVAAE